MWYKQMSTLFSCVKRGFDPKATRVTVQLWPRLVFVWSLFLECVVLAVVLLYCIVIVWQKNIAVSTRDFFIAFEICEVRISHDSHTVVFLSVYGPPPSRKNKLTNAMFLEQFSDLLESYVSCDRLFVVGDLNVHFDNPSDPCTAALNVILGNLSLEQLVNVLTHRRGHTLDWLITNRSTDVLNLTVAHMLLSDHFVISFDLLLRKPGRVTKKSYVTEHQIYWYECF